MTKTILLVAAVAAATAPRLADAHATISGVQPGPYKTAARTSYVIRVPNEKAKQNTIRLEVQVPAAVQQAISVKKVAGWKTKLVTQPTGQSDADGNPIVNVTKIVYSATRSAEIAPHFFEEWPVRFQNPATPQSLCFPMIQTYRGLHGGVDVVSWTGDPSSETPASCVSIVP